MEAETELERQKDGREMQSPRGSGLAPSGGGEVVLTTLGLSINIPGQPRPGGQKIQTPRPCASLEGRTLSLASPWRGASRKTTSPL